MISLIVKRKKSTALLEMSSITVASLDQDETRSYSVAEVFPEYIGKGKELALRAYRFREGLTQKQLVELTGISQHHISELETGKRTIGKERAKKLAEALHCDYRQLL